MVCYSITDHSTHGILLWNIIQVTGTPVIHGINVGAVESWYLGKGNKMNGVLGHDPTL